MPNGFKSVTLTVKLTAKSNCGLDSLGVMAWVKNLIGKDPELAKLVEEILVLQDSVEPHEGAPKIENRGG